MPPKPLEFEGRKELRQTFADIQKAQKSIEFYNAKIAKNDPFSPKTIRASYNELTKWNKIEREKVKLLTENDKAIERLVKHEKEYSRVSVEGIRIQKEKMSRTGYRSLLRSELQKGRASADELSEGLQDVRKKSNSQPMFDLSRVVRMWAAASAAFTGANMAAGVNRMQSEKLYALANPGELGSTFSAYGKTWKSGRYAPGVTEQQDNMLTRRHATPLGQNPLSTINAIMGRTGADTWETARQLSLSGGSNKRGSWEWMDTGTVAGALSGVGAMSMGQMQGLKSAAVRGGGDVSGDYLADTMAKAVALGLTGGRPGEFADSIKSLMEAAQATAGNTDPEKFKETMWLINNTGKSYTQGARGEQIGLGMQASLLNPGGGIAGRMMSLRAVGFGAVPGMSYFDAWKAQHGGLTPEIEQNVLKYFRQGGNKEASIMALTNWSNGKINPDQAEALLFSTMGGKYVKGGVGTLAEHMSRGTELTEAASAASKISGGKSKAEDDIQRVTGQGLTKTLNKLSDVLWELKQEVVKMNADG